MAGIKTEMAKQAIVRYIRENGVKPGEKLPSQDALRKVLGFGGATIGAAINELKDDGVLAAPAFTHAENGLYGKIRAFAMKLVGFPLHSRWTSGGYLAFLRKNGWMVHKSVVLKASFPLTYTECVKK